MKINILKPFASNGKADEFDVRQMKKALNRLGYYPPYDATGITDTPDRAVFDALRSFQSDHGLSATGTAKPDDETLTTLNTAIENAPDGEYIWRTVGDDRVRGAHAALNGTKRKWSDDPDPQQEFGCRCWAGPVGDADGLKQVVISSLQQASYQWTDEDFINHWKYGNGREVTLPEIGWLVEIIWHAKKTMFHKVEKQIADKARQVQIGNFSDTWERSYNFQEVVFSIGDAVIRGRFNGTVKKNEGVLHIEATAHYLLDDEFTDFASIRQTLIGTSDLDVIPDNIIGDAVIWTTEIGRNPYPITGVWTTRVTGSIKSAG